MIVTDAEIDRMARDIVAQHGARAARHATEKLNEMIDRGNNGGRDLWACIVHAIHRRQGTGPVRAPGGVPDWREGPPIECAGVYAYPLY